MLVVAAAWTGRGARSADVLRPWVLGVAAGAAGAVVRIVLAALHLVWGLAPAALIAFGAWLAWPPAGFIAAGALLLADRLLDERRERAAG